MKNIEIDEALYQHIVENTQSIGESASSILRRLLGLTDQNEVREKQAATEVSEKKVIVNKTIVNKTIVNKAKESVFNYINKEELAMQRGAVGRFLLILAALYRVHVEEFSEVLDIRGRDRLYFAASKNELVASGSSTKPFQIPDSPYWVITNSNTTRKKMMLTKAAHALGYSDIDVEKIRELL
ncbi:MAG: replication initiation negative regulator SeqA [Colwellia sp.]|nr:replication initiation negative regulator SeqA [Colwellia sp.]